MDDKWRMMRGQYGSQESTLCQQLKVEKETHEINCDTESDQQRAAVGEVVETELQVANQR